MPQDCAGDSFSISSDQYYNKDKRRLLLKHVANFELCEIEIIMFFN
jgi:hypothetical protein